MPVFDITNVITHTESIWDRSDSRYRKIKAIVNWLTENVGEYYGRGEDRTLDPDEFEHKGHAVLHIGSGWQLERDWKGDPDGFVEVWWRVDITDDAKATLFALKWIK